MIHLSFRVSFVGEDSAKGFGARRFRIQRGRYYLFSFQRGRDHVHSCCQFAHPTRHKLKIIATGKHQSQPWEKHLHTCEQHLRRCKPSERSSTPKAKDPKHKSTPQALPKTPNPGPKVRLKHEALNPMHPKPHLGL